MLRFLRSKSLSKSILNPMIYYYAKADASDTGNVLLIGLHQMKAEHQVIVIYGVVQVEVNRFLTHVPKAGRFRL